MPPKNEIKTGVSIVLGSYNRRRFLISTIESIRKEMQYAPFSFEIIVIDGGSSDGTVQWLTQQKDIITIVQHNRGVWQGKQIKRRSWGYFMNLGFKCVQYKYICMLSDDCLVIPGAIINGYNYFEQQLLNGKNVGAIAFYWRNWPEQEKYWVGLTFGNKMFVNHGMYLRKAIIDVGYIDETLYNFYHADSDLCLKLWQKGYSVIESPDSFIEHFAHANIKIRKVNSKSQKKDMENYLKKWEGIFYQKDVTPIGSWMEKDFVDSSKTWKKFQQFKIEIFRYRLVKFFWRVMGRVIDVYKL